MHKVAAAQMEAEIHHFDRTLTSVHRRKVALLYHMKYLSKAVSGPNKTPDTAAYELFAARVSMNRTLLNGNYKSLVTVEEEYCAVKACRNSGKFDRHIDQRNVRDAARGKYRSFTLILSQLARLRITV